MKTNLQRMLIAIAGLLISANAFAHDFEKDGIYYNILSETDRTVAVTYYYYNNGYYNYFSGNLIIPAKVIYNGKTYTVTSIGEYAFYDCDGLTSVTIPNSVTSIGDCAFEACYGLTSITIPNSVTSIGAGAFRYCYGLTSITIPNSVTSIGDYAFRGCYSLTEVTIGNSVTSIGDYAFSDCYGLTQVTIPNSVTSIGESAFSSCKGLTSIVVEDGNTKYDSQNNCNAIIETSTNTLIVGCKNTTIPNSVTSIGDYAFFGCSGLTSVEIPNSVTSIGSGAFKSCSNIRSIYCQSATPPSYPSSFADDVLMYSTLYVPTGCKSAYEAVDPWRNFWNIEEMEFNGIEDIVADGDEINVIAQNGEIVVNGIENAMLEVYNIGGQLVYSGNSTAIAVANKGIYIVKVSGKTFKIAL